MRMTIGANNPKILGKLKQCLGWCNKHPKHFRGSKAVRCFTPPRTPLIFILLLIIVTYMTSLLKK